MILRIRSSAGTWRLEVASAACRVAEVCALIAEQKGVAAEQQTLCTDPGGQVSLDSARSLSEQGVTANGTMLYLILAASASLPPTSVASENEGVKGASRRKIAADGSIIATGYDDYTSKQGFRPGMAALGDIKKKWTLTDFLLMDAEFNFKIKRQEESHCTSVTLDTNSCVAFQSYMQQLGWRQTRVAFLYGTFDDDGGAHVECIYEPPQQSDDRRFELLEDPQEDAVAALAALLGLRRVGWIFAHPPREKDFIMSGEETIRAAMEQLEAAQGVAKTPFVSVRVTVNEKGESNFEAYQVSLQCMAMVAEGALAPDEEDAAACAVHETFTAIVEGKRAPSVNASFFLCNVPVKQHSSTSLVAKFPKENRPTQTQTRDDIKVQLQRARSASGGQIVSELADFSLLLYLMTFPQIFDHQAFIPAVCNCIVDRTVQLDEGYKLILYSFSGLDF